MDKDIKEISASVFLSVTGGLFAGGVLAFFTNQLNLIPGLFVLFPGFLEMRGSITGALSSRIISALHMGKLEPGKRKGFLVDNIMATILLSLIVSLLLGIFAYILSYFVFKVENLDIIWISVTAALLSSILLVPMTIAPCFWLYKKGLEPGNIMGPYVTTIGDVTSVLSLFIAIVMFI